MTTNEDAPMTKPSNPSAFPILRAWKEGKGKEREFVPWDFVAAHERQAQSNHYQTVKRLAERGGLSWRELLAVVEDRKWSSVPTAEARARVQAMLTEREKCND